VVPQLTTSLRASAAWRRSQWESSWRGYRLEKQQEVFWCESTESQSGGGGKGNLVQPCCSSRATQSRLPRPMSRWLLKIFKDGDSFRSFCLS